jgi:HSP20 family protein
MYWKNLITRSRRGKKEEQAKLQYPLVTFHKDVNRLFDNFFKGYDEFPRFPFRGNRLTEFSPKIDVSENDKEIEVTAEVPGIDQSDIDVTLNDNVLTIKGKKKEEKEANGKEYYHVERSYSSFCRSLHVSCEIESDKVDASFKKGVLKIILPKSEKTQENVRKIEVKSE